MIRSYRELIYLPTFEERFKYLDLRGTVGNETFGSDRCLNQLLYHSGEWRRIRDKIIIRDEACDLGIPGREINDMILIHHINPVTIENIENGDYCVFDPDNLISSSSNTHNAIHFGGASSLLKIYKSRSKGDTSLW